MFIWQFIYAILFVAAFGGSLATVAYLALGIIKSDRSIIYFGLRVLLFTILAGAVFYLLVLREVDSFLEMLKNILK
jgi:hypothetical protein